MEKEAENPVPERGHERWEKEQVGDDPARLREERRSNEREFEGVEEPPDLDSQDEPD